MPTMIEIQTEIYNTFRAIEECDDEQREELENYVNEYLDMLAEQEADKIDAYAHVIREQSARIEFLKAEKKRIDARLKTANNGLDRMKVYMVDVLNQAGIKKATGNSSTLSLRRSEAVLVSVGPDTLPEELKTVKTTITPNKKAIKDAIKSGKDIDGCSIVENMSLQVR